MIEEVAVTGEEGISGWLNNVVEDRSVRGCTGDLRCARGVFSDVTSKFY